MTEIDQSAEELNKTAAIMLIVTTAENQHMPNSRKSREIRLQIGLKGRE